MQPCFCRSFISPFRCLLLHVLGNLLNHPKATGTWKTVNSGPGHLETDALVHLQAVLRSLQQQTWASLLVEILHCMLSAPVGVHRFCWVIYGSSGKLQLRALEKTPQRRDVEVRGSLLMFRRESDASAKQGRSTCFERVHRQPPLVRMVIFWGLYRGPLFWGELPHLWTNGLWQCSATCKVSGRTLHVSLAKGNCYKQETSEVGKIPVREDQTLQGFLPNHRPM